MNRSALCALGAALFFLVILLVAFIAHNIRDDILLYAAVILLVAIFVIGALLVLGPNISGPFSTINRSLNGV